MDLEKTCSCYIPSTTILLSVTDVGGVGEDLATMGQRGEDYADLHAWARTHAAGHGDGFAMTRQQHSPMLGLVPPLILATICWSAHVFANNNFCWAAHRRCSSSHNSLRGIHSTPLTHHPVPHFAPNSVNSYSAVLPPSPMVFFS